MRRKRCGHDLAIYESFLRLARLNNIQIDVSSMFVDDGVFFHVKIAYILTGNRT